MARIQKSREKILEMAGRLFSEKGYDATSVHEICTKAGVSKGAFYHYFSTKEILFLILMEEWVDRMKQTLNGDGDKHAAFPENILEMAGKSGEIFLTTEKNFSVIIDFWKQALQDPSIWARSVRPYVDLLVLLEKHMIGGQQSGLIRSDINPEAAAHLLSACTLGYLLQAALYPDQKDWTTLARNGFELVVNDLRS